MNLYPKAYFIIIHLEIVRKNRLFFVFLSEKYRLLIKYAYSKQKDMVFIHNPPMCYTFSIVSG